MDREQEEVEEVPHPEGSPGSRAGSLNSSLTLSRSASSPAKVPSTSSQRKNSLMKNSPMKMSPMSTDSSSVPPTPAQRLSTSKRKSKSHLVSQVKALLKKNYRIKYKRISNVVTLLLEIAVPVIFFALLGVSKLAKKNDQASSNDSQDLLEYKRTEATVGYPFPIMDVRWTLPLNESEIEASDKVNFCSYMGGAGNSLNNIFSTFTLGQAKPTFSPANQLLFAPNDEKHARLMRNAAKTLLCSRPADEVFNWELKQLTGVTSSPALPASYFAYLAYGSVFTKNTTHSYLEQVATCNYLYFLFDECLGGVGIDGIGAKFFKDFLTDSSGAKEPTEIVLGQLGDITRQNSTNLGNLLRCVTQVNADSFPELELLQSIVRNDPCEESCLNNDTCVSKHLDLFLKGFATEEEALDFVAENPTAVMGVVSFEDGGLDPGDDTYEYKIRVNATDIAPVRDNFLNWQSLGADEKFFWWRGYYPFVNIQHSVDKAIGRFMKGNDTAPTSPSEDIVFQISGYPTGQYTTISLEKVANMGLGLIFGVAWMFSVVIQTYTLVFEKETGLEEFQFIMGLNPLVYWFMHFVISFVPQIVISFAAAGVAGNPKGGFVHSNWTVLLVFFLVFQASLTSFVAALSLFFERVSTACVGAVMIYIGTLLPGLVVCMIYPGGNAAWIVIALLPASNAFAFGQQVMQLESVMEGAQWSNLGESFLSNEHITLRTYIIMAAFDVFLYLFFLWFFNQKVYKKMFDFALSKLQSNNSFGRTVSIWTGPGERKKMYQTLQTTDIPTVQIEELRKVYPNGVEALKGLTMDMYEGEVTALLGSNGAGKSTTISMLTGRLSPTSGDARILGRSLLKDISLIRRAMGVCTQYDSLWPLMTVREHMVYFAYVKGLDVGKAVKEMSKTLSQLDISHQIDELSSNLSGGQRRKLNLSLALLGDPYFILLDEPSTGMDPKSRKDTWDFIAKAKQERVILITTHYMDEAETLGDKIAIMSHGSLKCWGTPSYLKVVLKLGYQLRFLCEEAAKGKRVEDLIKANMSAAQFEPMAGTELKVLLADGERKNFPHLLRAIASNEGKLGIESYGLTCTTMEDVFLEIIKMSTMPPSEEHSVHCSAKLNTQTTSKLWESQFAVFLWKRFVDLKRDIVSIVLQSLGCIVLIIIGCGVLLKVIAPAIPSKQGAAYVSSQRNLAAPPSPLAVAQNFSDPVLMQEDLQNLYAEDFSFRFNSTAMSLRDFQENLLSNITNQRTSCERDRQQTCGALYYENAPNVTGTDIGENALYTLLFSQTAYHSPAASVNLFDTYMLRRENGSNAGLEIYVENHPLPKIGVAKNPSINYFIQNCNITFTTFVLGLGLIATCLATYVTYEKRLGANTLQLLSGAKQILYHLSNYVWDLGVYLVVCILIFVVIFALPTRDFFDFSSGLGATIALLLLFGPASVSFGYLLQLPFRSEMVSFGVILGINAIAGLILFDISAILVVVNFPVYVDQGTIFTVQEVFEYIFPLHPVYAVTRGLFEITWFSVYRYYPITCVNVFQCSVYRPFDSPNTWNSLVTRMVIYLACEAVIYFALFLAIEMDLFSLGCLARRPADFHPRLIDEDVNAERERVMSTGHVTGDSSTASASETSFPDRLGKKDLVVIKNLWVGYGKKMILKGLSFGLREGRCFGLLGVNGAGKSTFFKILTGATTAVHGQVLVMKGGERVDLLRTDKTSRSKLVGYCPQADALLPRLTVTEQLQLYGAIKGMDRKDIGPAVAELVQTLGITRFLDKQTGSLSGGNQRKVSVAVALLGDPALVLLDEPSAGLDPASRRSLWNAITNSTQDKTVVLTSHSMEECEALCDYIGLMSAGEFHAFGTIAHLKRRFGSGYTGILYVSPDRMLDVLNALAKKDWLTVDEICGSEIRIILGSTIDLAEIFEKLERLLVQGYITDYSVSPTTLDEIFLGFAGGLLERNFVCRSELAVQTHSLMESKESIREHNEAKLEILNNFRSNSFNHLKSIDMTEDMLTSTGGGAWIDVFSSRCRAEPPPALRKSKSMSSSSRKSMVYEV